MPWWDDLGDAADRGLGGWGLDPADWDLDFEPEEAPQRPVTDAYHPGFRGMLERYGPILAAGAVPLILGDRPSPGARGLAGALAMGSRYLQSGVDLRARGIEDQNAAARQQVEERNAARRQQVMGNRAEYRKQFGERLTPRRVVEQKMADEAAAAKAKSRAQEEGTIEARRAAGLNPAGTPPVPKPKTPGRERPLSSFRLFGPGDEIAIQGLRTEIETMRKDFNTKAAFDPPRKNSRGQTIPDNPRVAAARERVNVINRQLHEATKNALMYRLDELGPDVGASPNGARKRLKEIWNAAAANGLDKDPEFSAAAEAIAAEIEAAIGEAQ